MVVGLAPDTAADAHLAHHLQHGLVGDAHALLGSQAHRYLAVPAAVRGAREDLAGGLPELRPRGNLGVRRRVIVARPGQAGGLQQVGEGPSP